MCGVFGFVARKNRSMDLRQIKRIARVTMNRGDHAFGFAWINSSGHLRCFKQAGRIVDHLGLLGMASDARMLIGHCRFTTQGSESFNINNHPHPVDGGWLVHNGMIRNYDRLVKRYNLAPVSHCDTEILGHFVEQAHGPLVDRMKFAVQMTGDSSLVTLALWNRPRKLIAVRRENPLCLSKDVDGYYLGSLPDDLPGDLERVDDGSVLEFGVEGRLERSEIARQPMLF